MLFQICLCLVELDISPEDVYTLYLFASALFYAAQLGDSRERRSKDGETRQ